MPLPDKRYRYCCKYPKEADKIVIESKVGKLYEDKINLFGKKVTYETYKLPIYDENNNLKYIVGSYFVHAR